MGAPTRRDLANRMQRAILAIEEREQRPKRRALACARCGRDVKPRDAVVSRWTGATYCGPRDLESCAETAAALPLGGQLVVTGWAPR